MSNQDIIKTENVLVRIMELGKDHSTDWHSHTYVRDYIVCLNGVIKIEIKNPDEMIILNPGQRAEIKPTQIHRVVNNHNDKSEYLLVQGVGAYDFIKV